jgi:hypothetical protein
MNKYRVTLRKILDVDEQRDPRVPIARVLHRQWDITADSIDHARRKADAALREQLPNVRGFKLESIEELNESKPQFGDTGNFGGHSWPRKQ